MKKICATAIWFFHLELAGEHNCKSLNKLQQNMQVEAQQLLLKLANPRICALIVECIHNEKKPKSKTNTGNLKYEDSVMELHQILSHISPKQIERTLIYTAGNKELV